MTTEAQRHPLPPFTKETAIQKVRLAEDGWNSWDPSNVALAYTPDSKFRRPLGRRPDDHPVLSDSRL